MLFRSPQRVIAPELLDTLHATFGFSTFRGVQDQVVARVMAGQSTLAVMPNAALVMPAMLTASKAGCGSIPRPDAGWPSLPRRWAMLRPVRTAPSPVQKKPLWREPHGSPSVSLPGRLGPSG